MSHLKTTSHFGMKGRFCLAMLWIDILEWVWEMLLGKAYSSFIIGGNIHTSNISYGKKSILKSKDSYGQL